MKIIQAAVLVLVGALGAMLFLKVKTGPEAPVPAAQQAEQAATPAPVAATPVASEEPTAPTPAGMPKKKTPVRALVASRREPASPAPIPESRPAPQQPTPVSAPVVSPTPQPTPQSTLPVEPPAPVEPPPPPLSPPMQVTLKAGMLLPVRLVETVTSEVNHAGDTFSATLDAPLVVDGFVIAEKGARAEGRVVESQQAGRVRGLSSVALELTRLNTSDGQRVAISTDSFTKTGPESKGNDAAKIGGGAALGAIIGAIAGGGKGAAVGAGVGGAAGTGAVITTRGKPAVLPSETKISFRMNSSVTITERK